ncbi:hypothetical protein [Sutterella wadsworthensis]|uniref:hypothetical protein n=1 Tax=Sutterella wadsworthensis TaxID=40545 RepID=UPI003080DC15
MIDICQTPLQTLRPHRPASKEDKLEMTAARKIRAAVVGASGYAGSELTRFLLAHPAVELTHL